MLTLDSSRMRRQLSSHFCPGKVPPCTYCSIHVISFLPRHPAEIYPLDCPSCRYVGALRVPGCCRQDNGTLHGLPTKLNLTARACHYHHPEYCNKFCTSWVFLILTDMGM